MKDKLVLSIKPETDSPTKSADYRVQLNDWVLKHGVFNIKLDMEAVDRPVLIIECKPDWIEIEGTEVETHFRDFMSKRK